MLLLRILADIAALIEVIEVALIILPELNLIGIVVIEEALGVLIRVRDALARGIGLASFHAGLESGAGLLVNRLGVVALMLSVGAGIRIGK